MNETYLPTELNFLQKWNIYCTNLEHIFEIGLTIVVILVKNGPCNSGKRRRIDLRFGQKCNL